MTQEDLKAPGWLILLLVLLAVPMLLTFLLKPYLVDNSDMELILQLCPVYALSLDWLVWRCYTYRRFPICWVMGALLFVSDIFVILFAISVMK